MVSAIWRVCVYKTETGDGFVSTAMKNYEIAGAVIWIFVIAH